MKSYDIVIVGAATSGMYLAAKMAKRGYSVKVIEKNTPEQTGNRMDIIHVTRTDMQKFDMPEVFEGDPEWAFEFTENHFSSPSNQYSVDVRADTVGLHMQPYVALMAKTAAEAGADIEYCASFREFVFSKGVISGVRYETENGVNEVKCKVVIDCSGSKAVARTALPNGYGVENFSLGSDDVFYVILRYARFETEQINTFWLNTKSWYAPFSPDGRDKIIGTGAIGSFENAEKSAAKLDSVSSKGEFELVKTEKGTTPFRRPPYSFVADNFIVAGDAACQTKPDCGEGITSSMVFMDIAADVLDEALQKDDLSRESLWRINCEYNKVQGADFSMDRAFLTRLINAVTDEELEYCFKNKIVFNEVFLNNVKASPKDAIMTFAGILSGISRKDISLKTMSQAMYGVRLALELRAHYINFPKTPDRFDVWVFIAEKLWNKVGKVL